MSRDEISSRLRVNTPLVTETKIFSSKLLLNKNKDKKKYKSM